MQSHYLQGSALLSWRFFRLFLFGFFFSRLVLSVLSLELFPLELADSSDIGPIIEVPASASSASSVVSHVSSVVSVSGVGIRVFPELPVIVLLNELPFGWSVFAGSLIPLNKSQWLPCFLASLCFAC